MGESPAQRRGAKFKSIWGQGVSPRCSRKARRRGHTEHSGGLGGLQAPKRHLSKNGKGFAHLKECSSPWWESSQQLQLENGHSSLTPEAHRGSSIVFYVKNQGNDERSSSISKVTCTERSRQRGLRGVGKGRREKAQEQLRSICGISAKRPGCPRKETMAMNCRASHPVNTANPHGCWLNGPARARQALCRSRGSLQQANLSSHYTLGWPRR